MEDTARAIFTKALPNCLNSLLDFANAIVAGPLAVDETRFRTNTVKDLRQSRVAPVCENETECSERFPLELVEQDFWPHVLVGPLSQPKAFISPFYFIWINSPIIGYSTYGRTWQNELRLFERLVTNVTKLVYPRPRFVAVSLDALGCIPSSSRFPAQAMALKGILTHLPADIPVMFISAIQQQEKTGPSPSSLRIYREAFGRSYYVFWVNDVAFIVLHTGSFCDDSNAAQFHSEQMEWLVNLLESLEKDDRCGFIVLLQHVPWYCHEPMEADRLHFGNIPFVRRERLVSLLRRMTKLRGVFARDRDLRVRRARSTWISRFPPIIRPRLDPDATHRMESVKPRDGNDQRVNSTAPPKFLSPRIVVQICSVNNIPIPIPKPLRWPSSKTAGIAVRFSLDGTTQVSLAKDVAEELIWKQSTVEFPITELTQGKVLLIELVQVDRSFHNMKMMRQNGPFVNGPPGHVPRPNPGIVTQSNPSGQEEQPREGQEEDRVSPASTSRKSSTTSSQRLQMGNVGQRPSPAPEPVKRAGPGSAASSVSGSVSSEPSVRALRRMESRRARVQALRCLPAKKRWTANGYEEVDAADPDEMICLGECELPLYEIHPGTSSHTLEVCWFEEQDEIAERKKRERHLNKAKGSERQPVRIELRVTADGCGQWSPSEIVTFPETPGLGVVKVNPYNVHWQFFDCYNPVPDLSSVLFARHCSNLNLLNDSQVGGLKFLDRGSDSGDEDEEAVDWMKKLGFDDGLQLFEDPPEAVVGEDGKGTRGNTNDDDYDEIGAVVSSAQSWEIESFHSSRDGERMRGSPWAGQNRKKIAAHGHQDAESDDHEEEEEDPGEAQQRRFTHDWDDPPTQNQSGGDQPPDEVEAEYHHGNDNDSDENDENKRGRQKRREEDGDRKARPTSRERIARFFRCGRKKKEITSI